MPCRRPTRLTTAQGSLFPRRLRVLLQMDAHLRILRPTTLLHGGCAFLAQVELHCARVRLSAALARHPRSLTYRPFDRSRPPLRAGRRDDPRPGRPCRRARRARPTPHTREERAARPSRTLSKEKKESELESPLDTTRTLVYSTETCRKAVGSRVAGRQRFAARAWLLRGSDSQRFVSLIHAHALPPCPWRGPRPGDAGQRQAPFAADASFSPTRDASLSPASRRPPSFCFKIPGGRRWCPRSGR